MAHKKGQGSVKNGRDSQGQRLGVKLYGGQEAKAGSIIVRQRGTAIKVGTNVKLGKDDTIFSLVEGIVTFRRTKYGSTVSVDPTIAAPVAANA